MSHPIVCSLTVAEVARLLNKSVELIHYRLKAGLYREVTRNRGHYLISISELERIRGREWGTDQIEAVLGTYPQRLAMLRDIGFPLFTLSALSSHQVERPEDQDAQATDARKFEIMRVVIREGLRRWPATAPAMVEQLIIERRTPPIENPKVPPVRKASGGTNEHA